MVIRAIDIAQEAQAAPVLALQLAAYRVEAELIGRSDLPPLHETVEGLRTCGETFYGCFERETLAGAVAYKRSGDLLDLHRVMVHPSFFRRGVARALVAFVEGCERDARRVVVSTGVLNGPARGLYAKLGFEEAGEREVAPGFRVALYEKVRASAAPRR